MRYKKMAVIALTREDLENVESFGKTKHLSPSILVKSEKISFCALPDMGGLVMELEGKEYLVLGGANHQRDERQKITDTVKLALWGIGADNYDAAINTPLRERGAFYRYELIEDNGQVFGCLRHTLYLK